MRIFEIKDDVVTYAPQALLLKPFKKLWDRDKQKGKLRAKDELAFIWYMEDVRSDFYDIVDEDERRIEVVKFLPELPKGYLPDAAVEAALLFYRQLSESLSVKILKDTVVMINNLRQAMVTMDFTERDKSGKVLHDYNKALDLAGKVPRLLKNLKDIYRETEREAEEKHLMRGSRMKSTFEGGI